eukprot:1158060-Pelagomonas_calceolata.AAC.16
MVQQKEKARGNLLDWSFTIIDMARHLTRSRIQSQRLSFSFQAQSALCNENHSSFLSFLSFFAMKSCSGRGEQQTSQFQKAVLAPILATIHVLRKGEQAYQY